MKFDPNMTYVQSMKVIAHGLIQWPITIGELRDIGVAIRELLWMLGCVICRILALALYPISVPLLTLLIQHMRRNEAKRIAERKAEIRAHYGKMQRTTPPSDKD